MYKIYCATNKNNGMKYIGVTGQPLNDRINEHLYEARTNTGKYFQRALNKYGFDMFQWEIVGETEVKGLAFEMEKRLIKELNTKRPNGYNLTDGGEGLIGLEITDEHKINISQSMRGSIETLTLYKDSVEYKFDNISQFAREFGLHTPSLNRVLNRKLKQHKGFHLKDVEHKSKGERMRETKTCSYRIYFVDDTYEDFIKTDQRVIYEKYNLSPAVFNTFYKKRKPHKRTGITKIEKI